MSLPYAVLVCCKVSIISAFKFKGYIGKCSKNNPLPANRPGGKSANHNFFVFMEKNSRYKDPELAKKLVERIKELRKNSEATQETAIDQTHSDVYRYEAGRKVPTLMSIRKICQFYNISIREFFDVDLFDYPLK